MLAVAVILAILILGFLFDEAVHATLGSSFSEVDGAPYFFSLFGYMVRRLTDLPNAVLASARILMLQLRVNALVSKTNKGGRYAGNKSGKAF